ncbi:transposable element Tcb1 transposase [Trichonephila clavipes]|nr:transposable element Tcb1 transposase [Trichonephila clavipes]
MNSSQHRCMNQVPASENQTQQRSLNSSLEATVGSPLVHLGRMLLNGTSSSLLNSPLQPSLTSITYGPWYTTFATSLILDDPILPCTRGPNVLRYATGHWGKTLLLVGQYKSIQDVLIPDMSQQLVGSGLQSLNPAYLYLTGTFEYGSISISNQLHPPQLVYRGCALVVVHCDIMKDQPAFMKAVKLSPCLSSNHWKVGGRPQCDKCGCRVRNCSHHRFTTLETISNYKNSYPGFSSGRPRGTTPADDRYIVLQARRNRRQTAGEIARYTTQATGRPISRFTVARRLHGGGLFARRPVRCVPLTPAHRRRRSLWCREHRNWRDNE